MFKFGDTFLYRSEEYVFLAEIDQLTYAAKIIEKFQVKEINDMYDKSAAKGSLVVSGLKDRIIFCFVILRTKEYEGMGAHFKPAKDGLEISGDLDPTGKSLNKEDLAAIKTEIIAGPLPRILKTHVEGLEI